MGAAQKILTIMGVIYTIVGGGVLIGMLCTSGIPLVMYLLPAIFLLLGIGFLVGVYINIAGKRNIVKKGTRYPAKIYGYVDNTSVVVNGRFPQNVKVHYFDSHGIEREAVIPTSFTRGSNEYPIGMTIDIYVTENMDLIRSPYVTRSCIAKKNLWMINQLIRKLLS